MMNRLAGWIRTAHLCLALLVCSVAWANPATILVVGDSMAAEYGLPRGTGWVRMLADRLSNEAANYNVVNASISGETTSGGRARLPALLRQHRPSVVVIELGGNDGLRGLSLTAMRENLRTMVRASHDIGARVLLIGMQIPPNYGRDYAQRFAATFEQIAADEKTALVPFLLEGFADQLEFFQQDRIHPNERAQERILELVWPRLKPILKRERG